MASSNTYVATASFTPGAAVNVAFEIAAPSTKAVELIRLSIGTVTTQAAQAALGILFNRCTAGTTVWTAATITAQKLNPSDAAAGSVLKAYTSGTSTDGTGATANFEEAFNTLSGYLYLPVPEERLIIAATAFLAFKWSIAPPAASVFKVNVTFREIG